MYIWSEIHIIMPNLTLPELISTFCYLNSTSPAGVDIKMVNFSEIYSRKYDEISVMIGYHEYHFIEQLQTEIPIEQIPEEYNPHWKYVCISFKLIRLIHDIFRGRLTLTIEQTKRLQLCFKYLSTVGIACNIRPNLPHYVEIPSLKPAATTEGLLSQYNLIKFTTSKLVMYMRHHVFRPLIIQSCLSHIIVALYQLGMGPVATPQSVASKGAAAFDMTEELYRMFLDDQRRFQDMLHNIQTQIFSPIFIRENIVLFHSPKSPAWFLKEVGGLLTRIILDTKTGVQDIINVILEGFDDDSTKSWQGIEVCSKIIVQLLQPTKNQEFISKQLFMYMMSGWLNQGKYFRAPERIFVECTKVLYCKNRELCEKMFLPKLYENLNRFREKKYGFGESIDVVKMISIDVRLIHGCLLSAPSGSSKKLPASRIVPFTLILFRLYQELKNVPNLDNLLTDLKEVLVTLLSEPVCDPNLMFDAILFSIVDTSIHPFRDDIFFHYPPSGRITVEISSESIIYPIRPSAYALNKLIEGNMLLKTRLYSFYLNCVVQKQKYFSALSNTDLLSLENDYMNVHLETITYVYEALATMSESKDIQDHLRGEGQEVVNFVKRNLAQAIDKGVHKTVDYEAPDFQSLFVVIMVLKSLKQPSVMSEQDRELNELLRTIGSETLNEELRCLAEGLVMDVTEERACEDERVGSDYDRALVDICDSLLPVKAHGLMTLAKLLETKDAIAMHNQNYLLNIFQQNLKNEDSYIYLNAIRGLAALANDFTDTVLRVLCEEYSEFSREFNEENTIETRMKLGEVLVKVTKELGDMAPKYKALLLNTFLNGAKDEDHLIRASSLSNLGEICKVLGYKLGTMLVEVLICIQAVIATDKAPEPRRAAVTVVRQLFQGLGSGVIAYFKEDILPVYRLLKELHQNDKDDVVRLQAQVALEELNAHMKEFVFPMLKLHPEKSIIELN